MDYPNKTVYILDDTRRPHIKAIAEELGCKYITRRDNKHAKAGNLNNALKQTNGEFISIMDADFVPFKNFLTRTVGFFQNSKIDLVQTPQYFYNPDYHARNLGLDCILPNLMLTTVSVLSSIDQPIRRIVDRFPLCTPVKVISGDRSYWGFTNNLSETGAKITLTTDNLSGENKIELEFLENQFSVKAELLRGEIKGNYANIAVSFSDVGLPENRKLVEMLYCNFNTWKKPKKTGVIDSLLAVISSAIRFRPILNKY